MILFIVGFFVCVFFFSLNNEKNNNHNKYCYLYIYTKTETDTMFIFKPKVLIEFVHSSVSLYLICNKILRIRFEHN
jgi:hypothetical protein